MASKTEICNMAISHLGIAKEIANVDTEKSAEASAMRRFYDIVLESVLRDFPWPFASKIAALGLLEEEPNDEWNFSYQYPTDCSKIRRILSGIRNDTPGSVVRYKVATTGDTRIIFTDEEDAEAEYTILATNPAIYPADFSLAVSLKLASVAAPRLTGGDPFKLGERAFRAYQIQIGMSQVNSINEQQDDAPIESEFIRGRE